MASEKGTNIDPIELFLVDKLLRATKFEVPQNKAEDKKTPY